ncbi:MAG: hypothetical protein HVN35_10705 [Methanobacteriaceae archaeon]|nr:hypothetical protein [Methanobacteriaceae archaeon]
MSFRMMPHRKSKMENDLSKNLISSLAFNLANKGYIIKTKHLNNSTKNSFNYNGYVPALFAIKNGRKVIVEIESCKNIKLRKNEVKLRRFGFSEDVDFFIFAPEKCVDIWRYQVKTLDISAEIFSLNDFNILSSDSSNYFFKKIIQ